MPSETKFQAMETFVEVMKPIAEITTVVGAEKWVTISAVRPLLYKLLHVHLTENHSDTRLMKMVKKAVLEKLQGYYTNPVTAKLLNKACFLDPRFRTLPFLSAGEKEVIMNAVQDEAQELVDLEKRAEPEGPEPPTSKKPRNTHEGLMTLLSDVMGQAEAPRSPVDPEEKERREVQKYALLDAVMGTLLTGGETNKSFRFFQLQPKNIFVFRQLFFCLNVSLVLLATLSMLNKPL